MSYRIRLTGWSGEDSEEATAKLAKLFRMDEEESTQVIDGLTEGNDWQFDHQISPKQSEVAENFLQSLGFEVERVPADEVAMGNGADEDESESGGESKGKTFFKKSSPS